MTVPSFSSTERAVIIVLLLALGLCSRLLPHPPGATALTAVLVAGSLFLGTRTSLFITAVLLLLSDVFLGVYELPIMLSVYGSFLFIGLMSYAVARSPRTLGAYALLCPMPAVVFFLVTNAAVWYFTPWYLKSIEGLLSSYILGLPFLKNMLVGDVFYVLAVVGALAFYVRVRHSLAFTRHEHA